MSLERQWKAIRRGPRSLRARPRLECLEDRLVLSTVIEDFAPGSLAAYDTVLRFRPFAEVSGAATHDGQSGLAKQDGFEWIIRGDQNNPFVQQGQVISAWVSFADIAAGRAYFGFGARPNPTDATGLTRLADGGTLSLVLAPNTNQLILQANPGFNHPGISGATPGAATLGAVAQTYQADTWYRVEVAWEVGGAITGRLYASDGVTLLNTVTGSSTLYTQGGIAFRSFGRPAASPDSPSTDTVYFDTVVVAPLGTSAEELAAAGGGISPGGVIPGNITTPTVEYVSTVGGTLVPWLYESVAGTGRDVLLRSYSGPATAQVLGPTSNPDTLVVFSAANDSFNAGTAALGWGGPYLGGGFQNGLPQESPALAQYLFRQLPGEDTRLIASADIKHFYTAVGRSPQFLLRGENDIYGTGLNANRNLFLPASVLDPVVGDLLTIDDFGPRNADGVTTFSSNRPYSGGDLLLRARIADIDPAQNPAGTRWFLMGNLYDPGDQNVANNSRWIEVRAQISGSSVTWQTLNNPDAPSSGTLDFRRIPGLREFEGIVAVLPTVTGVSPAAGAVVTGLVNAVRVTFASPIDPATFTLDDFAGFIGPNGVIEVLAVNAVDSSNTRFDVVFADQATPGDYRYTLGPDIFNAAGLNMLQAFTGSFTIDGLRIVSTTPGGDVLPGEFDSLTLNFNQPIDPATLTFEDVLVLIGPNGPVAISAITPVEGSDNSQFRLTFDTQFTSGAYILVLRNDVHNPFGVQLDGSNGTNFYLARLWMQGVRVLSATPDGDAPGVSSLRVQFNVPVDLGTFTPAQISEFLGPLGLLDVLAVTPVEGTDDTQFDVVFAPLTVAGSYRLVLGPGIYDRFGNPLDPNENPFALFLRDGGQIDIDFTVGATRVLGTSLTGQVLVGTTQGQLTFNTPIDPATLTADRILLTRAGGAAVAVTGVTPVDGTNNTAFDFTFDPLPGTGAYTVALADGVQDIYGNGVAPFAAAFTARLITANSTGLQDIDLFLEGGAATLITSADDATASINLGSNTFTFYGVTYTGANRLFVNSNGLITFGAANSAYQNEEWPSGSRVPQPAIAVLWDDWIKSAEDAGANGPMVLARIDGDRLIIQWNRVRALNGAGGAPSVGAVTFQAILSLNTGEANGAIVLNYANLVTQDFNAEGLSASVGIKPAGDVALSSDNLLTISLNGQVPGGGRDLLVRTGQAVLINSVARDFRVVGSTLSGAVALGVGQGRLTFSLPVDPETLTMDRIVLTRQGGARIAITGVTAVAGSNNTAFDFTFAPITAPGTFTLSLASGVTDTTGFPMAPFSGTFTIAATAVASTTLTGSVPQDTSQGRLVFNRAIDPDTLTVDLIRLTRQGSPIEVTSVTPVAGSNNTAFDFTFAPLTDSGAHNLALVAGVRDTFGNAVTPFNGSFTVAGQSTVVATAETFQDIDLLENTKQTVIALEPVDDEAAQINLGGNTFTFFGVTYSSLFVSSNGLITFGSANTAFTNANLTGSPVQAAIAVLWDDWVGSSGNPMVLYRIENNQLIIQWNQVRHISTGTSTVTFQAILDLNTGSTQGDVVLNYVDVNTGAAGTTNGASATVGVKRAGSLTDGDPDRLLVSFNAASALVGSGQALRISPR